MIFPTCNIFLSWKLEGFTFISTLLCTDVYKNQFYRWVLVYSNSYVLSISTYLLKNMFCILKCINTVLERKQLCIKQIESDDSLDYIKEKICNHYSFPLSHIDLKPQVVKKHHTSVRRRKIALITFAYTAELVLVLMDLNHDFFKNFYG